MEYGNNEEDDNISNVNISQSEESTKLDSENNSSSKDETNISMEEVTTSLEDSENYDLINEFFPTKVTTQCDPKLRVRHQS